MHILTFLTGLVTRFLTSGTDMLQDLFDGFQTVASKIISFFTGMFTSVAGMIWESGVGLTSFGKLLIIPTAFGLFWLVFKWIKSLLRIK